MSDDAVQRPSRFARPRLVEVFVLVLCAAVMVAYSLPGGAYDAVVRHEAALGVWWVVALGVALGSFPRALPRAGAAALVGLLVLLAIVQAIGLAWTESDERTLVEVARSLHFAGIVVLVGIALDRTVWRSAVAGLTLGAIVVCGIAIYSRLSPSAAQEALFESGLPRARLNFPFDYWNAVGVWASMAAVLTLGWSCAARSKVGQALGLAAVPLAALTAYLTYSRTSLSGLLIGAIALLVVSRRRGRMLIHILIAAAASGGAILAARAAPQVASGVGDAGAESVVLVLVIACAASVIGAVLTSRLPDRRLIADAGTRRRLLVGMAVVSVIGAGLAGAAFGPEAVDQFRSSRTVSSDTDPSARLTNLSGTRAKLYASSVAAFRSEPLQGTGAGTFELWWSREGRDPETLRDAHSFVLEGGAEMGFPGYVVTGAIVVALLALPLLARFRRPAPSDADLYSAIAGALVVYAVGANLDWMWESTAVTGLAFALAGAVAASGLPPAKPALLMRRLPVAVLALSVGALQLPFLFSVLAVRESQAEIRAGQHRAALDAAREAQRWTPWAAEPRLQAGFVYQAAGQLDAARAEFGVAEQREPTNWRMPLSIARLEVLAGRVPDAVAALNRARELHPTAAFLKPPKR